MEILFRGNRIDGKGWIEGNLFYNEALGEFSISGYDLIAPTYEEPGGDAKYYNHVIDPSTIGQYINRNCSKTGEKIFDGMEVKFCEPASIYADCRRKKTGIVKFHNCSFVIETSKGVKHYRWMDYEVAIKK